MKKITGFILGAGLAVAIGAGAVGTEGFNAFVAALTASTTIAGTELIPIIQGGVSTKGTPAQLATYTASTLGANPSGTIGLSAVNGTATTFVRSDGAPALSQSIVPTWTGIHTFGAATTSFTSAEPRVLLNESDQGTNLKLWDFDLQSGVLTGRTRTDADAAGVNWIAVTRGATTAVSNISFGNATNNPTYSFLGTNTVAVSTGSLTVGASTTITTLGAGGSVSVGSGLKTAGVKFTASGCSNSTTVGGAIAGSFASGTTGTCTVVITLPSSTNGWACQASDISSPANLVSQSATGLTSCTITGTTVSGDTIVFSALGY